MFHYTLEKEQTLHPLTMYPGCLTSMDGSRDKENLHLTGNLPVHKVPLSLRGDQVSDRVVRLP